MYDVLALRSLADGFNVTAEDLRVLAFDMLDGGQPDYVAELDELAGGFDELSAEVLDLADLTEMYYALPEQRDQLGADLRREGALVVAFAERLGTDHERLVA